MRINLCALLFLMMIFCSCNTSSDTVNQVKDSSTNLSVADSPPIATATTYKLKNDTVNISVSFWRIDSLNIKFHLEMKQRAGSFTTYGSAELVRENDNGNFYIPEGTPIPDDNTNQQYTCDSTYSIDSKNASVTFGFEKATKKRLSLSIGNSKEINITDGDYTLYKVN